MTRRVLVQGPDVLRVSLPGVDVVSGNRGEMAFDSGALALRVLLSGTLVHASPSIPVIETIHFGQTFDSPPLAFMYVGATTAFTSPRMANRSGYGTVGHMVRVWRDRATFYAYSIPDFFSTGTFKFIIYKPFS